jgi:hypothetical protein
MSERSGHLIRLFSITVAGAAPALDESAPDFPFYPLPSQERGHLTPREACLHRAPYVKIPRVGIRGARQGGALHGTGRGVA